MTVTGLDFLALQVTDLERAAAFYEDRLGLRRAAFSPPHAVVFDTTPAFAVREPMPGFDPAAVGPWAGAGVVLWLQSDATQELHDSLADGGVEIVTAPTPGPFGLMFAFRDPDGYVITIHDQV
ncbi:VOC family protein [Amnibacterium flavum]|uniref:Glyoxalase n=1 Tax=Amnibacterium flavum TaxID=2173173 RepID=A0A2V1HX58_9MICO|nr:VOC family protein [Amnibacterium flavum]PVZ94854.1 glyoxalase [Amnibacterium flavum]